MRHKTHSKTFSRKPAARQALLKGLVRSLVEHGRIKTTLARAKEVRRHAERAITRGKTDSLHARRVLLSKYPWKETMFKIVKEISPRFKERLGGYTRIIKLGTRPGDAAEMAFLEWVDYDYTAPKKPLEGENVRTQARARQRKRKHLRQMRNRSARINRPQ